MAEVNFLNSYPSNSNSEHKAQQDREKAEKVVKGKVIVKKPSIGKRLANIFIGQNVVDVKSWARDNAILWLKNSMLDGLSMIFFGRPYASGTSYRPNIIQNVSKYTLSAATQPRVQQQTQQAGPLSKNYNDLVFSDYRDADEVLSKLVNRIELYGNATVNDLYDYSGVTAPDFTSVYYGWTSLGAATIAQCANGYTLVLPNPVLLR